MPTTSPRSSRATVRCRSRAITARNVRLTGRGQSFVPLLPCVLLSTPILGKFQNFSELLQDFSVPGIVSLSHHDDSTQPTLPLGSAARAALASLGVCGAATPRDVLHSRRHPGTQCASRLWARRDLSVAGRSPGVHGVGPDAASGEAAVRRVVRSQHAVVRRGHQKPHTGYCFSLFTATQRRISYVWAALLGFFLDVWPCRCC